MRSVYAEDAQDGENVSRCESRLELNAKVVDQLWSAELVEQEVGEVLARDFDHVNNTERTESVHVLWKKLLPARLSHPAGAMSTYDRRCPLSMASATQADKLLLLRRYALCECGSGGDWCARCARCAVLSGASEEGGVCWFRF
jgi:hypothetical protein